MDYLERYTIPINWEILHGYIFDEAFHELIPHDNLEFMSKAIPQNIFDMLFSDNGVYHQDQISALYYSTEDAEEIFSKMRSYLLTRTKYYRKKTIYDISPVIDAFCKNWDKLIPDFSEKAEDHSMELQKCIQEVLCRIPRKYSWLSAQLKQLCIHDQFPTVLAVLSIVATALPIFGKHGTEPSDNDKEILTTLDKFLKKKLSSITPSEPEVSYVDIPLKILHEKILIKLAPASEYSEMKKFLLAIIPEYLLDVMNINPEKESAKKYLYGVYHAHKSQINQRCERSRLFLTRMASDSEAGFLHNTFPLIQEMKSSWEKMLPVSCLTYSNTSLENHALYKALNELLALIPDEPQKVRIRLTALCKTESYSMVLAILSAFAATLLRFTDSECAENQILFDIFLPPMPPVDASPELEFCRKALSDSTVTYSEFLNYLKVPQSFPAEIGEAEFLGYQKALQANYISEAGRHLINSVTAGYAPAVRIHQQKTAEQNVQDLRKKYHEHKADLENQDISNIQKQKIKTAVNNLCRRCEASLRFSSLISSKISGEAAFYLFYFIDKEIYISETGKTAKYYLEIGAQYGNEDASNIWEKLRLSSLPITPTPAISKRTTTGVCYSNTENVYADTFEKSLPDGWKQKSLSLEEIEKSVDSEESRRFLLFDENYSKNLEDLCRLLQAVKSHLPRKETLKWEIFIRHDSESIHMLIDTAMARLSEYQIPIHILNDAKIAAQQLLSQHPLFYPIRFLPLNSTGARPLLHFVVVGTSAVSQWLIREAFWMMSFRRDAVRTKITVLAKNAKIFVENLTGCYPGMARNKVSIQNIELAEIEGTDVDLNTAELADEIKKITKDPSYCYFAVAEDTSDNSHLALATRIREFLIRAAITSRREDLLQNMPPVAVLCRNDQAAWLTRFMVVEGEEYGSRWYNTRGLIPFGQISSRYTFDEITGGTFEQLSKCIHFQYSQLSPDDVQNRTKDAVKAEEDYYRRQYNQDSSYSIALSMPYRIFQFQEYDSFQIYPTAWNILEKSTFSSVEQLRILASRIIPGNEANITELAEYEHARWTRWMLSRGWMPASFEDAVFAYQCGNPRPQLFSAKLHPCICAYDDQKLLSQMLYEKCGIQKDFYSYDKSNIRDTQNLLKLAWIPPKDKTSEKEPDPER